MLRKIITSSLSSRKLNSGQAIVLIAFAAVGLIAIMGLSIDGGRVLLLQRRTQNAADAAVLAATRAMCRGDVNYVQAGLNTAAANDFNNDNVTNTVSITPATDASITIPAECQGCYLQAVVKGDIPGTFISMFYGGPLEATSRAIAVCNPNVTDDNANKIGLRALWGIGDSGCHPANVEVSGASVYISGGFHSNADVQFGGGGGGGTLIGPLSYVGSSKIDEKKFTVQDGSFVPGQTIPDHTILGQCSSNCFKPPSTGGGGSTCTDEAFPGTNPFKVCDKQGDPLALNISAYAPGGAKANAAGSNYHAYSGSCGGFDSWLDGFKTGGSLTGGLFYSTCDLDLGGVTGIGTFVTMGDIKISGGFNLTAYQDGLLFFADSGGGPGGTCQGTTGIKISGSSNHFTGNIYAPHGEVDFSGASNNTTNGCIVAWGINLSGSSNQVICNPNDPTYTPNPGIGMVE